MKEIQKYPDIDWNKLEKAIDDAIDTDEPYIVFKIIEIEECKYMQKVAEAKLSKLSDNINGIFFLVAFGLSLTLPFIFGKSLDVPFNYNKYLIAVITIVIISFVMYLFKSFIKGLSTLTGFVSGIIVGISLIFGILAVLFIFNKSLTESIGFVIGIIIVIFCILFALNWRSEYNSCNKIILNAERKLLWMEIEQKYLTLIPPP